MITTGILRLLLGCPHNGRHKLIVANVLRHELIVASVLRHKLIVASVIRHKLIVASVLRHKLIVASSKCAQAQRCVLERRGVL